MDFLAENNSCGQCLLRLVARGNSIIAELLRLKEVVPSAFRSPTRFELQRYGELLSQDFTYFKTSEHFESKVEGTENLTSADEELKEAYLGLLTRFYRLFESVHRYAIDLRGYLQELTEGNYIQQSAESVFLDEDGKQLMCEALYLYGVLLLLVDLHIEGPVRERLLVSYYRYSGQTQSEEGNFDDICKLLRSTGFSKTPGVRRPQNYPELLLNRIPLPESYVRMVIGRLRCDDIYNQIRCYPDPEHRSTALSAQAAMLYVCLFFTPNTLKNESAVMREIVDKFFPDNWVISFYLGSTVNLVSVWEPYKAAKSAMGNTLLLSNVRDVTARNAQRLEKLLPETDRLLKEGVLSEENVLDHIVKILNMVRDCNDTLRWMMLHTTAVAAGAEQRPKRCRHLRELVISESQFHAENLFSLLLNTAHFELKLRDMYRKMLNEREVRWNRLREECREKMAQLAEAFGGGEWMMGKPQKNARMQAWFLEREKQISSSLDIENPLAAGRIAIQLIEAINEALELQQGNLQIKQSLVETKTALRQMIRTAGIKEDVLVMLQVIGDFSYGWEIVDSFTDLMQEVVQQDPVMVGILRATFLKLSSALEGPVLRISQAKSKDFESVSQYYSSELVVYIRKVLQIIPETMFSLLDKIVDLQTNCIGELPTRLDKDKLRSFYHLKERFEVAKYTHSISLFTEGMSAMKSTLVGVVKIDPRQLLEDGVRTEIVRRVTRALDSTLVFSPKAKETELSGRLEALRSSMLGFRQSFEYIQDYVGLPGLKIWQEEFSRVINFTVEQEANLFLRQKVPEWASVYQSKTVPIQLYPSVEQNGLTFMGRLANVIIHVTSPKSTTFVKSMQTWYDCKSHDEVVTVKHFSLLESAVGTFGLVGIDRLFGLKAAAELQNAMSSLDKSVFRSKTWTDLLENLSNSLNPHENVIAQPGKFYLSFLAQSSPKILSALSDAIVSLGQLQLLRNQIAYQLSLTSNFDSKTLHSTLHTLNRALLADYKRRERRSGDVKENGALLFEVSTFLQWSGIVDPNSQIYVTASPAPKMSELVFLVVISTLGKATYSSSAGNLASRRGQDPLDGHCFVLGSACLLRQFPDWVTQKMVLYLSQYARSFAETNSQSKGAADNNTTEVHNVTVFLEKLAEESKESQKVISQQIPNALTPLLLQ